MYITVCYYITIFYYVHRLLDLNWSMVSRIQNVCMKKYWCFYFEIIELTLYLFCCTSRWPWHEGWCGDTRNSWNYWIKQQQRNIEYRLLYEDIGSGPIREFCFLLWRQSRMELRRKARLHYFFKEKKTTRFLCTTRHCGVQGHSGLVI